MKSREWSTRIKRIPKINDVKSINKIVAVMIRDNNELWDMSEFDALWLLDCLIYVAIVAWYSVNGIKCKLKKNAGKQKPFKPYWLDQLEKDVLEKRKLISKCVAEKQRISENSRITRRTRRNRKEIEKLIGKISLYSLTKLICKLKAQVHRLAQTRKRKMKNLKARDWNNMFHNNQSQVFKQFKAMIDQTDEGTLPKFKEF